MSESTPDATPGPAQRPAPKAMPKDPTPPALRAEIDRNFGAFEAQLPKLLAYHRDQFALMRHGEIVEFFETSGDACTAGRLLYPDDQLFSVQEVTDVPLDLGFHSYYALPRQPL